LPKFKLTPFCRCGEGPEPPSPSSFRINGGLVCTKYDAVYLNP
jgi:hypothetical protein